MADVLEQNVQPQQEMTDEDIVVIAHKEIKKAQEEAAIARKELNKFKLLYNPEEQKAETLLPIEEYQKMTDDPNSSNIQFWKGVVGRAKCEMEEKGSSFLGKYHEDIVNFAEECIDESNGDAEVFRSIYQSKLGADDKASIMAYNAWKQQNNK